MSALANRDFVKMNGLGNEIVIVDLRLGAVPIEAAEARAAAGQEPYDQLMALYPARGGTDALGPHLQQRRLGGGRLRQRHALRRLSGERRRPARPALNFETAAGLIPCWRSGDGRFTVDMGAPRLRWDEIPLAEEIPDTRAIELEIGPRGAPILHSPSVVSMGNPHAIFWVDDPSTPTISPRSARCSNTIRCFPSAPISRSRPCRRAIIS